MKAIVVGCGRVGSSLAKKLTKAGWDVSVVDENEEALARLGENWSGEFHVGHGMDVTVLRGRASRRRTPWSSPRTATTRTSSSPRSPRSATGSSRSSALLDPARAEFYAT